MKSFCSSSCHSHLKVCHASCGLQNSVQHAPRASATLTWDLVTLSAFVGLLVVPAVQPENFTLSPRVPVQLGLHHHPLLLCLSKRRHLSVSTRTPPKHLSQAIESACVAFPACSNLTRCRQLLGMDFVLLRFVSFLQRSRRQDYISRTFPGACAQPL